MNGAFFTNRFQSLDGIVEGNFFILFALKTSETPLEEVFSLAGLEFPFLLNLVTRVVANLATKVASSKGVLRDDIDVDDNVFSSEENQNVTHGVSRLWIEGKVGEAHQAVGHQQNHEAVVGFQLIRLRCTQRFVVGQHEQARQSWRHEQNQLYFSPDYQSANTYYKKDAAHHKKDRPKHSSLSMA